MLFALFPPAYKHRADEHRRLLVALGAPGSYCACSSCRAARACGYDPHTGRFRGALVTGRAALYNPRLLRFLALLSLALCAGCGGAAISGVEPSYVRATDELRGSSVTAPDGEVVAFYDALERAGAMWDVAGAHVRAIGSDDPVDGPVVRAEMATSTELAVDSNEGDTSHVMAYYSGTLRLIRTPRTFPYGGSRANDEMCVIYAHEIGHAMGLPHLPEGKSGIMSPAPSENLQGPTQDDLDLFRSVWPR